MATNFPSSLDALTNPTSTDTLASPSHSGQHTDANDAIEALQAKVGVNGSAVTTSHDYKIAQLESTRALVGSSNTFTANQIISASSSSDLLRITQTGAGNALVVEDSTNPDSTPFVVNADGKVLIGNATDLGNASITVFSDASLGLTLRDAGSAGGRIISQRSAGTIASPTAVASGNVLAQLRADGYDGTSYLQAANINFAVDSAVSTGTVPGRIIFSTGTTGTTTERMRIDSAGQVGIGTTPVAGRTLTVAKTITGSTAGIGLFVAGVVQSDVTASASLFRTSAQTQDAVFTLATIRHFFASQSTFGASSTVTEQLGFYVDSTLTGATTNIAFRGELAAATGRWNLYMGGTANNYLAGRLGVGSTSLTTTNLLVSPTITGGTTARNIHSSGQVQSDVTTLATYYSTNASTQATAFTLANLRHYTAQQGTFGAGSAVTTQVGFYVENTLSGATSNYAFQSEVASGTNRFNLYMNGTANNYLAGRLGVGATLTSGAMAQVTNTTAADKVLVVKGAASQTGTLFEAQNSAGTRLVEITSAGAVGIGGTPAAGRTMAVSSNLTGSTVSRGVTSIGQIQSDVTSTASYFATSANTNASAFTVTTLHHYAAIQGTFGATSAVTTQIGFIADNTMTGATNNYGFYGDIASGTNRWNLYMSGTADNYLAGNLMVGTTTLATSSEKTIHIANGTAPTANPTNAGVLYVESGALKYRGSSGTITTIANA